MSNEPLLSPIGQTIRGKPSLSDVSHGSISADMSTLDAAHPRSSWGVRSSQNQSGDGLVRASTGQHAPSAQPHTAVARVRTTAAPASLETPSVRAVAVGPKPSLTPLQYTVVDPFENETPWSVYEVLKTLLVGVTLFPIRLAVLIVTVLIGWVFVIMSGLCLTPEEAAKRPFSRLRRWLKQPMAVACRIIMWCLGFWWIKRHRSRNRVRAGIIVSNHISLVDVFYHIYACIPSALSKASVAEVPVVAQGAKAMQTIFINRKSAESRAAGLELLRHRSTDDRFPPILIFPEGTTTNGQCLIEFKRGAFVPGVTVQPIILRYPCSHYNPADTGRHAGNVGLFWLMLQFANWIEVKELEPYSPTQAERDDPLLFARNVQSMMAAAAKVPTTDHSYHDFMDVFDLARAAKVPQTFTLAEVRRKYGLTADQVAEMLREWPALDEDADGLLTWDELSRLLRRFAVEEQLTSGVIDKACLAAHNCTTSTTSHAPTNWAEREARPRSRDTQFDFPTAIHARALLQANEGGYGYGAQRRPPRQRARASGNTGEVAVTVNPAHGAVLA